MAEADQLERDSEQLLLFRHRFNTALEAGLNAEMAAEFAAGHQDIGQLRDLAEAGCPPELIVRLIL
jgi:hypothetical protein